MYYKISYKIWLIYLFISDKERERGGDEKNID